MSGRGRVELLTAGADQTSFAAAGRLLHDFNREYDEPSPPPGELATRLLELVEGGHVTVLLGRDEQDDAPVGVAVMRLQPSLWSRGQEAYLAELYVVPPRRGEGYGRSLITRALHVARTAGADYAFVITTEEDQLARRLYEAAGFRRTEGADGPLMLAYEQDL